MKIQNSNLFKPAKIFTLYRIQLIAVGWVNTNKILLIFQNICSTHTWHPESYYYSKPEGVWGQWNLTCDSILLRTPDLETDHWIPLSVIPRVFFLESSSSLSAEDAPHFPLELKTHHWKHLSVIPGVLFWKKVFSVCEGILPTFYGSKTENSQLNTFQCHTKDTPPKSWFLCL